MTGDELQAAFEAIGVTAESVNLLAGKEFTDSRTGQEVKLSTKAWVNFDSMESAEKALSECGGSVSVDGTDIKVVMSIQKEKVGPNTTKQIFIRNLDWSLEDWQVEEAFKGLDGFVTCSIARQPDGKMKGFGFVSFETNGNAKDAIDEMDEVDIGGRPVMCKLSIPNQKGAVRRRNNYSDDEY